MKTTTITIKGRKVRCRALKLGELVKATDLWGPAGSYPFKCFGRLTGGERETCPPGHSHNLLRPLKSKPRTAEAGKPVIKTIKAWIDEDFLDPNLCPGEGFWRMYSTAHDHWEGRKFIEVTISYSRKKK